MGFLDQTVTLDFYNPDFGNPIIFQQTRTVANFSVEFEDLGQYETSRQNAYFARGFGIDLNDQSITFLTQRDGSSQTFRNSGSYFALIEITDPSFGEIRGYSVNTRDISGVSFASLLRVGFDERALVFDLGGLSFGRNAQLPVNIIFANGTSLDGTAFDDFVRGAAIAENIISREGADTIFAGGGDDTVFGNLGNDLLFGNQGVDAIYGGQDADTIYGGQQNDILFGNLGNDILLGNLGDDVLFGGQGNDTIFGGQGADIIFGDRGNDVLSGDLGGDRFAFGTSSGADLIIGFSRSSGDHMDLMGQTYSVSSTSNGNALLTLSGGGTIELAGVRAGDINDTYFG